MPSVLYPNIVKLDIGGVKYKTSIKTLRMYPHSYLGKMFNGQIEPSSSEDGEYFIDSNGEMFKYILDFLRRSVLMLPDGFKELDLLYGEAVFFKINPLIQKVEELRNENEESNKKKLLTVWSKVVEWSSKTHNWDNFVFLRVSYLKRPGKTFKQIQWKFGGYHAKVTDCLLKEEYEMVNRYDQLDDSDLSGYLHAYGVMVIPEINNGTSSLDASCPFLEDLKPFSLEVWSK